MNKTELLQALEELGGDQGVHHDGILLADVLALVRQLDDAPQPQISAEMEECMKVAVCKEMIPHLSSYGFKDYCRTALRREYEQGQSEGKWFREEA